MVMAVVALEQNVAPQLQPSSLSFTSNVHRELPCTSTNAVNSRCIHRNQSFPPAASTCPPSRPSAGSKAGAPSTVT
ncbi:hypothetical protein C0J52_02875 [Blattella germanica]|nr:hypothetical protein C0J52_02875 [Blattella germanica]